MKVCVNVSEVILQCNNVPDQVRYFSPVGEDITSARSSDTDMTGCSTVLQGGGAACQC